MKKIHLKKTIVILLVTVINMNGNCQTKPYTIAGTGVSACYNNTTTITCPSNTTDAFYGQFHGTTPSYQNNGDGTITDLNTGLMWVQARGSKISWDSAFIMASKCTVGGHNDWRVPTIKELYSLMNFTGRSGTTHATCTAYIDTTYFGWNTGTGDGVSVGQRIIDAQDWTASEYNGLTMVGDTTIFGLNTVDGRIKGYPKYERPGNTNNRMYVRYVRGNTNYGKNNYTDNGDSTVTDNATGLMWTKFDSKTGMNWQNALAFAQAKNLQNYLGYNDWRLPDAKELHSIVDYSRSLDASSSAAIDPVFSCTAITDEGGNNNYPWYWSSTTHLDNMGGVYIAFGEALGWMKSPPTATYYTLLDVHGAGAQRSDPKSGDPNISAYYLGLNATGDSVFGRGPQGDVQRINNFVRLVRDAPAAQGMTDQEPGDLAAVFYPNPTTGILHIEIAENKNFEICIYNSFGDLVMKKANSRIIDLGDLSNGLYFLAVRSGSLNIYKKIFLSR
jgi:hypothetical protein